MSTDNLIMAGTRPALRPHQARPWLAYACSRTPPPPSGAAAIVIAAQSSEAEIITAETTLH